MEDGPKITTAEAILLVLIFGIADVLSLIPIVNWIILIMIGGLFLVYLLPAGKVRMDQVVYAVIGGGIIEAIPAISFLPGYLAVIFRIIYLDRKQNPPLKTPKPSSTPGIKNPKRSLPAVPPPKA